jgi:hypothetical protein
MALKYPLTNGPDDFLAKIAKRIEHPSFVPPYGTTEDR